MKFAVRKRRAPLIIIVSLVDILIILLIFFVVSTTFKRTSQRFRLICRSPRPRRNGRVNSNTRLSVSIKMTSIKLDGRAMSVDELEGAVRGLPEARKSALALQADRKLPSARSLR